MSFGNLKKVVILLISFSSKEADLKIPDKLIIKERMPSKGKGRFLANNEGEVLSQHMVILMDDCRS